MFRVGMKVVCVDAAPHEPWLRLEAIYTVGKIYSEGLSVIEIMPIRLTPTNTRAR